MPTVSQMLISSTWAHPFQTCPVEVTRGTQLGRLGPALLCCQPLVRSDECTEKIEKPSDCTDRFLDPSITISSFAVYPCRTFGTNQDFKLPDVQTTTVNLNSLKRGQIYYLYLVLKSVVHSVQVLYGHKHSGMSCVLFIQHVCGGVRGIKTGLERDLPTYSSDLLFLSQQLFPEADLVDSFILICDFAFPGHRKLARAAFDSGKARAAPTHEINGPGPTALCGRVLAAEQRWQHFYIQFVKPQKSRAPRFPPTRSPCQL